MPSLRTLIAAPAIVLTLAAGARAQVDAQAKNALDESIAAIKKMPGITFKVARETLGFGNIKMGGEASFKYVRTASPAGLSYLGEGFTEVPVEGKKDFKVLVQDNKRISYVDFDKKEIVDGLLATGGDLAGTNFRVREILLPPPFREDDPLGAEVRAGIISMEPAVEIAGEQCQLIKVVIKEKEMERFIAISALDRLPRKYEQVRITDPTSPKGRMSQVWTITDLKIDPKLDLSKETLGTPEGFKRTVKLPEQTGAMGTPQPTPPASQTPAVPGLAAGTAAPSFELPIVGQPGKSVTNKDLAGSVTVLGFWGSRFPQSQGLLGALDAAQRQYEGKNVKIFGVACREEGENAVKGALGNKPGATPILLGTGNTSESFAVRGFPSAVVIGADGTIRQFFEGNPSEGELSAAIDAAMK